MLSVQYGKKGKLNIRNYWESNTEGSSKCNFTIHAIVSIHAVLSTHLEYFLHIWSFHLKKDEVEMEKLLRTEQEQSKIWNDYCRRND